MMDDDEFRAAGREVAGQTKVVIANNFHLSVQIFQSCKPI
jgi:hypothetical protein